MLDIAYKYKSQLQSEYITIMGNEKYRFYFYQGYTDYNYFDDLVNGDWNKIQKVSIKDGKILGYLSCGIDRVTMNASGLSIMSFNMESTNRVFVTDLLLYIDNLFNYYFINKLNFSVFIGNPTERMYDKFILNCGGRGVGVNKREVKLVGENFYRDQKLYEILSEDYKPLRKIHE